MKSVFHLGKNARLIKFLKGSTYENPKTRDFEKNKKYLRI